MGKKFQWEQKFQWRQKFQWQQKVQIEQKVTNCFFDFIKTGDLKNRQVYIQDL